MLPTRNLTHLGTPGSLPIKFVWSRLGDAVDGAEDSVHATSLSVVIRFGTGSQLQARLHFVGGEQDSGTLRVWPLSSLVVKEPMDGASRNTGGPCPATAPADVPSRGSLRREAHMTRQGCRSRSDSSGPRSRCPTPFQPHVIEGEGIEEDVTGPTVA